MGNICPCINWGGRRHDTNYVYDVHQETFDMEDTVKSHHNEEHSPNNQGNVLTDQLQLSQNNFSPAPVEQPQPQPQPPAPQVESDKQSESLLLQEEPKPQPQPQPVVEKKPNFTAHILNPGKKKKKYDPDDYRFINQKDSFRVKKVDSIKEQQYNIDNCHNCEYFIFDITANLYIDDCTNCTIFVAPCESSIFVRNCKGMNIVAATGQFRIVDTFDCSFSLYCKSQPVIESSNNIRFTSFEAPIYPQFAQQLAKIRLHPWNNHWSQIHNFTKKQGETHFTLHRSLQLTLDFARAFNEAELINSEEPNPVPFIYGDLPYESTRQILLLMPAEASDSQIRQAIAGAAILQGFQGKGTGQVEKKVLLLDAPTLEPESLQNLGEVVVEAGELEQAKAKWFVKFGDKRDE